MPPSSLSVEYNGSSEFTTIAGLPKGLEGALQWTTSMFFYEVALTGAMLWSVSNGGSDPLVMELQVQAGGQLLAVWDNGGSGTAQTGAVYSAITPYHATYVFNGGGSTNDEKVQVYVNGVNQGPLTFAGTAVPSRLSTGSDNVIYLGVRSGGAFGYNAAFMQEIRMWEAALTPAEVLQDYDSTVPVRPEMLRLWAPFSGKADTSFYNVNSTVNTITHNTASADGGTLASNKMMHQAPTSINHHPSRRWRTRRSFTQKNVPLYPLMHRGM